MATLLGNLGQVWQRTSLVQRVVLLAVPLACIGAMVVLVGWARKPDMGLLYSRLSPEEAARIVEKVRDADVPYELKEGGTAIYVPQEKVYSLRLNMASQGLPIGEQDGYSILDKEKLGASSFMQRVNYLRAIEGELAKTITLLDNVVSARVHVVKPEGTFFAGREKQSTATVVLRTRAGRRLSAANVAAVVHLVAGGVEGLSPEKVVLVDGHGNLLSGEAQNELARGTSTILEYKARVEDYLAGKAEEMLAKVLGPNHASVKVDATIETVVLNQTRETYDPAGKVVSKETMKSKSSTGAAAGGGPAAVTREETTDAEYMVSKTIEQKNDLPGKIKSLTVAAFVDLSAPAGPEGESASETPAEKITLADVEQIIRNAIGLTDQDSLKVVNVPFNKPAEMETMAADETGGFLNKDFLLEIARRSSLGILVIGALLTLKIFGGSKSKPGKTELTQSASTENLLPTGQGQVEPEVLRARITRALQQNPDEVKRLFLNWIEGDKGEV